jgi:multidrug efflux system outer membrane protein
MIRVVSLGTVGLVTVTVLAGGCRTVGPNYARPAANAPASFRDPFSTPRTLDAVSLADQKWFEVFQDEQLQTLVRTALAQNDDLRLAAARILEAEAQLGITHADELPSVSATAALGGQRTPLLGPIPARTAAAIELQGSSIWNLDFWGKYRRATEAARAQLLANEWGRRAVVTGLISQVADAYFELRTLDLELDVSQRTLASRQQSLALTRAREQGGATSLVDVRQAEQLVYGASAEITDLERRIAQQENLISGLLGNNPAPVVRGRALADQPHPPEVPAGLPSTLLERRPDVQETEAQLAAATAQIGVAKADFFPHIALTGSGGIESTALGALFSAGAGMWSALASLAQPVFTGGRTKSAVALAEARRQEAAIVYGRTVRGAFREVANALTGYRKTREFRERQELLFQSAQDARRLADVRYQGGATSYLEVLDADTRLFDAELGLAEARFSELADLVELYRALGGGWAE